MELVQENVFIPPQKAKYIIMKIGYFKSSGGATYNYPILSIEHVLPQNLDIASQWIIDWSEEERNKYVNKICNLVLLTRRRNSAAQNYDFDIKKEKYIDPENSSPFPLTQEVVREKEWIPEVVQKRQTDLIRILTEKWEI